MEIIVASNNEDKIKEIKEILIDCKIYSLKEKNINVDVIEDQNTFEGNALKKAKEVYDIVHLPVIADDSGFCITSLKDFPGVFSHRFLGENKSDSERNNDLINRCNELDNRNAKFITVIVYYDGTNEIVSYGELSGNVSYEERGDNGFAFDKILELDSGLTVAELTSKEKNEISARKKALNEIYEKIKKL